MRGAMRAGMTAGMVAGFVALSALAAVAQSLPNALPRDGLTKDSAAKVELYPIPTLTLSDQQFLTGSPDGKPVTVSGELRIAQGNGRLPAVVLVHGSGGIGAAMEAWVHTFNAMGISTFVIDGFTGRGFAAVNTNQALLGRLNLIIDAYHALDILGKHPRVDPERIVLMGF